MEKKKGFIWDESCLLPNELEAKMPDGETILFREFPRQVLTVFINECVDRKFIDKEGNVLPFSEIEKEQADFLFTYLAKAAVDPKYNKQYFNKLEIPERALGHFVEMLWELNALNAILATSGNVFMLPTATKVLAEPLTAEEETKAVLEAILPAS